MAQLVELERLSLFLRDPVGAPRDARGFLRWINAAPNPNSLKPG